MSDRETRQLKIIIKRGWYRIHWNGQHVTASMTQVKHSLDHPEAVFLFHDSLVSLSLSTIKSVLEQKVWTWDLVVVLMQKWVERSPFSKLSRNERHVTSRRPSLWMTLCSFFHDRTFSLSLSSFDIDLKIQRERSSCVSKTFFFVLISLWSTRSFISKNI